MNSTNNTSPAVLRNLVSTIFQVDPRKVYLEDKELDPNYKTIYSQLSGGMWYSSEETRLWGFSSETGFKELSQIQFKEWNVSDGIPQNNEHNVICLHQVPDVDKYLFFLEKREYYNSIPSNGIEEHSITWTLYKSPNFKEYWQKIEKEDIERWSSWINNN